MGSSTLLKILHITPTFYPATYWGGPIASVYGLCNALASRNADIELKVLTSDSAGPSLSQKIPYDSVPVRYDAGYDVYFHRRVAGKEFAPSMLSSILKYADWADVIHLTYVYSPPTIPALLVARLKNKPIVWSARGALQRWEESTRPMAKAVWEYSCNALIRKNTCALHVTSEEEARASKLRIPATDIVIIPNGVEIYASSKRTWLPEGCLRILYIGRLHPIKGLENLLLAMRGLTINVKLTVCGTGDAKFTNKLKLLAEELSLKDKVEFLGHVTGMKKDQAFYNSDLCIVPSYTENFGVSVAEAMAHGVPVIASKGTPWAEVEQRQCGWWVDNAPATLAETIKKASVSDLQAMGKRGQSWMEDSYSWDMVANKMLNLYDRMSAGKCQTVLNK